MTAVTTPQLTDGSLVQLASSVGHPRDGWGIDIQITPIIEGTCNETQSKRHKRIGASYPTINQVSSYTHTCQSCRQDKTYDIADGDSLVR